MYKDQTTFEPKVLVFACNWCSYAGADNAGVSRISYSPNVRLLRTMCSGRVHPSFVLKAFREGADGVIVSGCHFGDCHYMFGNYKAEEQYKKLKQIVKLLGIEEDRIALEWISAAEGPRFAEVINNFVEKIKELGPSPFSDVKNNTPAIKEEIDLSEYKLYECLECGRCTGICPVARYNKFSPRRLLSRAISRGVTSISSDSTIWSCLTCKMCENVCPADIPYSDLNKAVRSNSYELGVEKTCTHGGVFEEIAQLMTSDNIKQNRLDWLDKELKIKKRKSDTIFFTGCSPYFAAYFGEPYEENLIGSLKASIKLLNKINIEPLVMSNEVCCGHDLLLRGEKKEFKKLSGKLSEEINKTGAKRIVFSCPECYVTLRDDYPKIGVKLEQELIHISELINKELRALKFNGQPFETTYHDPCRLGRYSSIYDEPRNILSAIPGVKINEMQHSKKSALCCGNTAWIGCNSGTKELQNNRLEEAYKSNSENMLTACPKCFIHLTCALQGENGNSNKSIKINDMWKVVESHLL